MSKAIARAHDYLSPTLILLVKVADDFAEFSQSLHRKPYFLRAHWARLIPRDIEAPPRPNTRPTFPFEFAILLCFLL